MNDGARRTGLDAATLAAVRQRLEARVTDLSALIEGARLADVPVSPDKAIGRLTRQDALQQQQMSAALVRRYAQELARVREALDSIAEGTYGACVRCGEPIAAARLSAMPHASLCVRCAERSSRPRT